MKKLFVSSFLSLLFFGALGFFIIGCGGSEAKMANKPSPPLPARLEYASQTLAHNNWHAAQIIRDNETGEEFLWVRSTEGDAICPIGKKNEKRE
tara:strand:- start:123 stop:404 length:282 start_codon:yes stop_codon:yes gene_type:complete